MNQISFVNPQAVRALTDIDFRSAAEMLNVEEAAIRAFAEVESPGPGFMADGRPEILYEAHKFHQFTNGRFANRLDRHGVPLSVPKWNRSLYGAPGAHQYERLADAMALDVPAALKACSWGEFQLMGFNYDVCGYGSVEEMVQDHVNGVFGHLLAFCNYIKSKGLDNYMRDLPDAWAAEKLAEGYNGPEYKRNQYDTKILTAYRKYAGGSPPSSSRILRSGSKGADVRALQRALGLLDDGDFGPRTERAVREFQSGAGLKPDGIAGPITLRALGL